MHLRVGRVGIVDDVVAGRLQDEVLDETVINAWTTATVADRPNTVRALRLTALKRR